MISLVLGFVVGLIVGWNFMSQPKWIKDKIDSFK